jgi:hypothetical protein
MAIRLRRPPLMMVVVAMTMTAMTMIRVRYNNHRYHESLSNLTPADVAQTDLKPIQFLLVCGPHQSPLRHSLDHHG